MADTDLTAFRYCGGSLFGNRGGWFWLLPGAQSCFIGSDRRAQI